MSVEPITPGWLLRHYAHNAFPMMICELIAAGKITRDDLDRAWRSGNRRKIQDDLEDGARAIRDLDSRIERLLSAGDLSGAAELAEDAQRIERAMERKQAELAQYRSLLGQTL